MSLPEATAQAGDGAFRLAPGAPGTLSAEGPLTFTSACRAYESGVAALGRATAAKLEIDCRGITSSDSAGLAVLLEWLSLAKRAGRSLRYTQLPPELAALARISDVEDLLERGV